MSDETASQDWADVLEFWFPEGRQAELAADRHLDYWHWRMRDGDRAFAPE